MTEETDDEIRERIYSRYQHIFDSPNRFVAIPRNGPAMGAPPREWIPKAIDEIEAMVESGMAINKACGHVEDKIAKPQTIDPKPVEMT